MSEELPLSGEFEGIKIYAAGRVALEGRSGWRGELFKWQWGWCDGPAPGYYEEERCRDSPIASLPGAIYVGPYWYGCDHGVKDCESHQSHGVGLCGRWDRIQGGYQVRPHLSRPEVARASLEGIEKSTHVFVWLDDLDAFGTLVEIGYARALGKRVHLYYWGVMASVLNEHAWFAGSVSTSCIAANNAKEAWADFCLRLRRPGLGQSSPSSVLAPA